MLPVTSGVPHLQHAACLTGLERSYPEIAGNVHVSLSSLFGGLQHVALFGVRPAQDPWNAVHKNMHLKREVVQTPCGVELPRWYTANGKFVPRVANNFVQSLCDLAACDDLLTEQEALLGQLYVQVARVRLDIAWELPLTTDGLLPLRHDAVYVPRMNAKGGICDKFAFGLRAPMRAYLRRVYAIPTASALFNTSRAAAGANRFHALDRFAIQPQDEGNRSQGHDPQLLLQEPTTSKHTAWQLPRSSWRSSAATADGWIQNGSAAASAATIAAAEAAGPLHSFRMSSEAFAEWSMWRANVSVVYNADWHLCKFSDATNWTARTCVPRMRRKQPCSTLICEGQATDCGCRVDGLSCASTQAWYCRDVKPRGQIDVDGTAFGGARPRAHTGDALPAKHGCDVRNTTTGKRFKVTLLMVNCKWVPREDGPAPLVYSDSRVTG